MANQKLDFASNHFASNINSPGLNGAVSIRSHDLGLLDASMPDPLR